MILEYLTIKFLEKNALNKNTGQAKKETQIDNLSNEQVLNDLKTKRLPTFGTAGERRERLKKHYGIEVDAHPVSASN